MLETIPPRRFFNSLFRGQDKAIQAGLNFNPIEFDGIKTGIVEPFPNAEELNGITVSQPVPHQIVGTFGVVKTGDVRETNEVLFLLRKDVDGRALNFDGGFLGFAHVLR